MDPDFEMKSVSDNKSEGPVMLSYATICDTIKLVLGDTNIPFPIKKEVQAISNTLKGEIRVNVPKLYEVPDLTVQNSAVSVFDHVSLATMAKAHAKDSVLGLVIQYMHKGGTKGLSHFKIRCKTVHKYLLQFDQLMTGQGILHWIHITNNLESQQLVLPKEYHQVMLCMLHDDYGHQGLD